MVTRSPATRYDHDRAELAALLDAEPAYRIDQLWNGLYAHGVGPSEITTLPARLRAHLDALPEMAPALHLNVRLESARGDTVKWLWELPDGRQIETVLMHYRDRSTVCVSSQAGCAMACGFCATGQSGFDRHLTTGEIVEQVVRARTEAAAAGRRLSNVVFMGMGEPMANYDNVWASIERIHADMGVSARHITVSTVGVVPGMRRLAEEALPVTLAVSLHAANDALRDELVPVNRRYPIAELVAACRQWQSARNRRLSFEWAMIAGRNDRDRDIDELAGLAGPLHAHVNLIPLNPTPSYATPGSSAERVRAFRDGLTARGVNATIRRNRGTDIDAACGQLRASAERGSPVQIGRLTD